MREQKLGDVQLVTCKSCLISAHQLRLADRRAGLGGSEIKWTLLERKCAHSGGDRTARDRNALMPSLNQGGDFRSEARNLFGIEPGRIRMGQNPRTKLENDAFSLASRGRANSHELSVAFLRIVRTLEAT